MTEEMQSLEKNITWSLVELSKEKKFIRYKWVYRVKDSTLESISANFKNRLVAKEYV